MLQLLAANSRLINLFSATHEYTWVMANSGTNNLAVNRLILRTLVFWLGYVSAVIVVVREE